MKTNDFNEQHQQVDKFMCRNGWVHVAFETNPLRGDGLAQNIVSSSNSICLEYIISILEIVKMTSQKNTYKILNYFFPNEHLFVNNKYNNFIWTWSKYRYRAPKWKVNTIYKDTHAFVCGAIWQTRNERSYQSMALRSVVRFSTVTINWISKFLLKISKNLNPIIMICELRVMCAWFPNILSKCHVCVISSVFKIECNVKRWCH